MNLQKTININKEKQKLKETNSVNPNNPNQRNLSLNRISTISFLALLLIGLSINHIGYADITPVSDRTQQVRDAIVAAVPDVSAAEDINETHLTKIQELTLASKNISTLKTGDFSGLTGLKNLNLSNNKLRRLPAKIFEGLTSLQTLRLSQNLLRPFPIAVSLKSVENDQFRAEMPTGAPFNITVSVTITGGTVPRDTFNLKIPIGKLYSETITVTRTPGTTQQISVDISTLSRLPAIHLGYYLRKSDLLPLVLKVEPNTSPEFSEGIIAMRSLKRNIAAGENIGEPISATDPENDTLTYSLSGQDAALFDVDTTNGQLKAKASTDYTVKSSYYLTLKVSDGKLTDEIVVVIEVPENKAPVFSGEIARRSISDNIIAGTAIGEPVSATDANKDTLTFSIDGADAAFFDIDTATGQLKAKPAVDYKTKSTYYLNLTVSDGSLTDTIIVIIDVVTNRAPVFPEGAFAIRRIPENTPSGVNVGPAVSATDMDEDSLTYTLDGADAHLFTLNSETGQIKTKSALDYEKKSVCFLKVFVTDGAVSDSISVLIALINTDDIGYVPMIVPVSERTPAVRDAIVDALPDVDSAEEVTDADLATITELVLRESGLTALKIGDFSGLTGLESINLHDNQLTSLPFGIFEGLTSLKKLRLGRNTLEPFPLVVSMLKESKGKYRAFVPTGAPFDIVVPIEIKHGLVTTSRLMVTIPKGSLISSIFVAESSAEIDVTFGVLPRIPVGHFGYVIAKSTVCNRTKQVADAINMMVPHVTDCYNITDIDLAKITALDLSNMDIPSLTGYDFRGMLSLSTLSLKDNEIKELPEGLFYRLVSLKELDLSGNSVDPLSLTVSLEKLADGTFNVIIPAGAPFDIEVPISIENGTIEDGITSIALPMGSVESRPFSVTRDAGTKEPVSVELGEMPTIPLLHRGYVLVKGSDYQLEIIPRFNTAPIFTEGMNTTRSVAENTAAGSAIGSPITATDAEEDTLTYRLTGEDAEIFDIETTTGQLRTRAPLDFERKRSYSVLVSVMDIYNARDSIRVTITITDVFDNKPPIFSDGRTAFRYASENTDAGENIGIPISATDSDGDTLTYTLSGEDAAAFNIDTETGQLLTLAPLNYESKSSYSVIISVSDGMNPNQNITVQVFILDVDEVATNDAPVFTEGDSTARTVLENTAFGVKIGEPVSATDADGDTLTYTLGGTDVESFLIDSATGQLSTLAPLDFEEKSTYLVTISVSDSHSGEASILVAIIVRNVFESPPNRSPVLTEGVRATRTIQESTASGVKIGNPIFATDADNDTLTYKLSGVDASLFSIDSTTGQIYTKASLDYERKTTHSVTVTVSDGNGGSDSIAITIYIRDVNENRAPVFVEGAASTRSIAENTGSGVNIGNPVSARDTDNDTLTYSLSGQDAASFSIDSSSGQLRTQAPLDYEGKSNYSVTISVSDGNLGVDRITVTILITDIVEGPINSAPVFRDGTATSRSVSENASVGSNIGTPVSATDVNNDTLIYSLSSTDASLFDIDRTSGQLRTRATLNYEDRNTYNVIVSVSDNKLTATINVTIYVTDENDAPEFSEGGSIRIEVTDNVISANVDIGSAVSANDEDNDSLTYSLGGDDASYFDIDESTGQISTNESVDFTSKTTYTFTVIVTDSSGSSTSTTVVITLRYTNNAPVFTEGSSTTRSIPENTLAGVAIGSPVSATDLDNDTLIYSLSGTDGSAFRIDSDTGQLRTFSALDFETKPRYSVTITVDDSKQGTDTTTVTISVINVNETPSNNAPEFTEGTSTIRTIAENSAPNTNIGNPIYATDDDSDQLRYVLSGTDAASFSIDANSGQLKTLAPLDFEDDSQYVVIVTVSDNNQSDRITVTINVTNDNDSPAFADGTDTTRTIREHAGPGINIGEPVAATDDDDSSLTYLLGGTDQTHFNIDSTSGQLRTKDALNFETKPLYAVIITATDNRGGTTSIDVEIRITNENDVPVFSESGSVSRTIAENTNANLNIGTPVSATDEDRHNLTYRLSGVDALSFDIDPNNGQLKTKDALDHEMKASYSVVVSADDNNGGIVTLAVTITVSNVNDAPIFTEGISTTRSVPENAVANTNIGSPVTATDQDDANLTYSLRGTDAASFDIDTGTGQLKTKSALDFDNKAIHSVTVSVTDNRGGSDSIVVTIEVTEVIVGNNAPTFTDGATAIRIVAENSPADTDVGTPVAAEDADDDTLTYSLNGTDAASFDIDDSSGQIKTKVPLDFETKPRYSVTVSVTDNNGGDDSIDVTINISNVNDAPIFSDGTSTTRSVAENTAADQNIGTPVAATDQDDSNLTYGLAGTDAASFDIDTGTGQLKTKSALDFSNKPTHSVTVSVTDNRGGSDSIAVTIEVTEVIVGNNAPTFTDGATTTRSVAENSPADTDVGTPVAAEDADDDTLDYSLTGTDAASFDIDDTSGQIKTKTPLDFETKPRYSVTVSVTDNNGGSDSIDVTINLSNVNDAPIFSDGTSTTRSVAENTAADQNIGTPVAATDQDDTSLTYSLGGTDDASFDIDDSSGQIKTKDALDFETKATYSVSVSVTDNRGGSDSIDVTINISNQNDAPVFTEGASITRSVAENTAANQNIGNQVSATDQDGDTLTYSLGGTDDASFDIDDGTGQLKTKSALDREDKASYSVTITVRDNRGGVDTIAVTITVTDVNEPPVFDELGNTATRSIAENSASDINIGSPVSATDPENNNLTYTLSGTDMNSFDIDDSTGQLKTKDSLNFEVKSSYSVTVSVTDNTNPSVSIPVTINVTDVEPETVEIGDRTQAVIDAIIAAIGDPNVTRADQITATHLESITTLDVQSKEITNLKMIDFNGLTALETLYLQDNLLTSLPAGIFADLSSLTTLDLSAENIWDGNQIESLPVAIFNSLPRLTNLNLSNNKLRTLPATVFNILGSLTCLDLHGNDLQSLNSSVFDSMIVLEKLDLSENELESLPSDIFNSLTILTSLDLSENELTSLHSDIFDALTALTYLNISDNPITSLASDIFENLTALTTLDMSSLDFSSLPSDLFDDLSSLTSLILADNGLSGIPDAASAITSLTSINLSSNPLTLTVGMFDDLTSLTEIILSDIGLTSIPSGFFDSLTQLTSVVLSDNPLTSLSGTEFNVLTSLETLDLSSNQLTAIPDGLFVGLTALKYLHLSNGDPDTFLRLNPVLEKVSDGKFKAVLKPGAPYTMNILVVVTGGATVQDGVTGTRDYTLTIPVGGTESETLSVERGSAEDVNAVSAFIEQVIVYHPGHTGYGHLVSREPIEVLPENVPVPMIAAVSISDKPLETQVLVNYPNPFNPETWIPFQLAQSADVSFIIYNMKGDVVRELALGQLPVGYYKSRGRAAYWDGRNGVGEKVSAGIYFIKFVAGDFSATRKMLIVK